MKNLLSILKEEYKILEHAENEILLEEPTLDFTPEVNGLHHELSNSEKGLEAAIKEYKKRHEIREKKSQHEILKIALLNYENRTIEVDDGEIDYEKLINAFGSYKEMSFVASYKHYLFDPFDRGLWEKHNPKEGHRLVLYALDDKGRGESDAIKKIASFFGHLVAEKRKKYNKYHSKKYYVNIKEGLHMRPASQIVNVARKYEGDVWIRIDVKECDAKSILNVLMLSATHGRGITVLYKPKEKSGDFYRELEAIQYDTKPLLIPYKRS